MPGAVSVKKNWVLWLPRIIRKQYFFFAAKLLVFPVTAVKKVLLIHVFSQEIKVAANAQPVHLMHGNDVDRYVKPKPFEAFQKFCWAIHEIAFQSRICFVKKHMFFKGWAS